MLSETLLLRQTRPPSRGPGSHACLPALSEPRRRRQGVLQLPDEPVHAESDVRAVGDFTLPSGREVVELPDQSKPGIAANLGNPTFADVKVTLVIDCPAKKIAMYGDCGK